MTERLIAFAVRWLILAVAVWVAAELVPGIRHEGWRSILIVALILGLLNAFLKPLLVFLSLPITVMTLGLFLVVINTGLLALTAWLAGKAENVQFAIDSFAAALLGAVIISIITFILSRFVNAERIARNLTRGGV